VNFFDSPCYVCGIRQGPSCKCVKLTASLTKTFFLSHPVSENLYQSCGIQGTQYEEF